MPNMQKLEKPAISPQDVSDVQEKNQKAIQPPKVAGKMTEVGKTSAARSNVLANPLWLNPNLAAAKEDEDAKMEEEIWDGESRAFVEGQKIRVAKGLPGDYEKVIYDPEDVAPPTLRSAEMKPAEDQGKRISNIERPVGVPLSPETDASFDEALVVHFTEPDLLDEDSGVHEKPQKETGADAAAV